MIHTEEFSSPRPIDVPLLLSALGPKGKAIAKEIADGIITIGGGVDGVDWCVQMVNGTVLDPGEDLSTARVKDAAGPWFVLAYHGTWQMSPEAVDGLPLGAEWRADIEGERPEGERHLAVHEGHAARVMERDRKVLDQAGEMLSGFGWIGDRDAVRARADAAYAAAPPSCSTRRPAPTSRGEVTEFAAAVL